MTLVARPLAAAAASESQVMDKLHAFFVALEYLNICEFSYKAGPLQYLSDLEEWRHEKRGLALLLSADSLIRKKVYRLNSDHKQTYPNFSDALKEVLQHHKQLWNDARSSAELDKFKQAHSSAPATPPRTGGRKRSRSRTPPAPTPKARKNKARRERAKQQLKALKGSHDAKKTDAPKGKPTRDARIPAPEWTKVTSFKYSGPKRCPFYNCSSGCRFGDQCKHKHACVECGQSHPYHGNH